MESQQLQEEIQDLKRQIQYLENISSNDLYREGYVDGVLDCKNEVRSALSQENAYSPELLTILREFADRGPGPNTPIDQLMDQYRAEGCSLEDPVWLLDLSRMYAERMPDCQVRCLLQAWVELHSARISNP